MTVDKILKELENFELMILRGFPIPFTAFVFIDINKAKKLFIKINDFIPEKINEKENIAYQLLNELQIILLESKTIPFFSFSLVNIDKICKIIDEITITVKNDKIYNL